MDSYAKKVRILLVGGGTGGHFYPLISIAEALNVHDAQDISLYYAGPNKYDTDTLAAQNIQFVWVPSGKRRRYSSLLNFFDTFKTFGGLIVAILKLYIIYPDVVMSKGGYTSVPVVLAAAFLRIPIVIHESDSVVGKANKLAASFARAVVVSYPETKALFNHSNVLHLGIPIRTSLRAAPSQNALTELGVDPDRPVILVLGGSQGAERINELILDSLDELLGDMSIIHQTGKQNYELCKSVAENLIPDEERLKYYHPTPFLSGDMLNDAYHVASIVISRAGSNSIYEIALHHKPSILIPIPETVSHDQRTNAYTYARSGATTVMEEGNITDILLRTEIDRIMQNEDIYNAMSKAAESFAKQNAAEEIGGLLTSLAQEH
ncbi:MAG: UDP-N-acetylglucosamine--N-acetylmuramyl-(pentapeptide) pyrophosphoryl-undecaprenol N-acetylglucosamine transferase [Minisyncoccia bacterium]